jgi:hypothetical protein
MEGCRCFQIEKETKKMKKGVLLLAMGLLAAPVFGETKSFDNVSLVDVSCSKKAAANPDAHTRSCALGCQKSGFGILTADGKFIKFDAAGNAKIVDALKSSSKDDHLRVNVSGDVEGDTIKVESVSLL